MGGPYPRKEPYIDVHAPNPSEVRDEMHDNRREGTKGWYPVKPDDDTPIWRYMGLGKFASLIQTSQLWFSHTSKFDDPYEGRYSKQAAEEVIRERWGGEFSEEDTEYFMERDADDYASCWNIKHNQSVALWKLYIEGNNGVAIKSTVGELRRAVDRLSDQQIEHRMEFGKVNYHITGDEPMGYYAPVFTKREIFEFESEYRAVLTVFQSLEDVEIDGVKIKPNVGIGMKIDLDTLINEIYISPGASGYLREVVECLLKDHEQEFPIEKSTVFDHPLVDS